MIPLRSTVGVDRFPRASLALVLLFLAADVIARLTLHSHVEFLSRVALVPGSDRLPWFAWLFHVHLFALTVSLLYLWVFTPALFAQRPWWAVVPLGWGATGVAVALFRAFFATSMAPVLFPEAFVGALLGMAMRRDIWGTVNTVVIGPGWLRLYAVPSYVLLFFWFFYLLLGILFLPPPFDDAPMLYGLPFVGFLVGFLIESLWQIVDGLRRASRP